MSRAVTRQVSWAQKGLTSVFGMGTGGSPSPLPPENVYHCQSEGLHPRRASFMPHPLYALRITRVHIFPRAYPHRLSASTTRIGFQLPLTRIEFQLPLTRTGFQLPLTRTGFQLPLTRTGLQLPLTEYQFAYSRRLRSGYFAYTLQPAFAFSLRLVLTRLPEITLAALAAFAILALYASCTLKTPYASTRQSLFLSMVSP